VKNNENKFDDDGEGNERNFQTFWYECQNRHYDLVDPEEPNFHNGKPRLPLQRVCTGCGLHSSVRNLEEGMISGEERSKGFTLKQPSRLSSIGS